MPLAVVLLSGGLDSAVALAVAKRDGFELGALTVNYGQRHAVEVECARAIAARVGVWEHVVLDLDLRAIGGSSLTSNLPVSKDGPTAGTPSTYVPARNSIFLSLALALAEARGAERIYLGVNAVDYSGYPDCRPEFLEAFRLLARVAVKEREKWIRVEAPLVRMSKREIVDLGTELGVPFSLTSSCYDPEAEASASGGKEPWPVLVRACGRCDSCRIRIEAFRQAGRADPITYASGAAHEPSGRAPAGSVPGQPSIREAGGAA